MHFLALVLVLLILPVNSQLSVTWNGSTITGPVLIYFDEILMDNNNTTAEIGDVTRPGALVCRSEDKARVSWHFTTGRYVSDVRRNLNTTIIQISTEAGLIPSLSRLSHSRMFTSNTSEQNGVWHCRLNHMGTTDSEGATYEKQFNVGIFATRDRGRLTVIDPVFLASSSFATTPPIFTLHADTIGGPPTNYTWTRNGQIITHGGSYNISISLRGSTNATYFQSLYRSTLTVTGHLPGLYQYFATNRATPTALTSSYTIEGANSPTNLRAVQTGAQSVLVSWTEPSPPPALGYRVASQPGGVNITVSSSPLTVGLQPGLVYSIQVSSLSSQLPSLPAGPVQVEVRVLGTVSSLEVVVEFTSVFITWTPPQETEDIVANSVSYTLNDDAATFTTTTDNRLIIRELPPNTRVSAISVRVLYARLGLSHPREHLDNFTIPENPMPPMVMTVHVDEVSATSLNVSWESVTVPGIVSYTVYYRPTESMGQSEQAVTVPSSESSVVIQGLMTGVEYQFQVAVIAMLNETVITGERSGRTLHALPSLCPEITNSASAISIAVVLTFFLTLILCAILRLVEFGVTCARNSVKKQEGPDLYEEVDMSRQEADVDMAIKENAAYDSVTDVNNKL